MTAFAILAAPLALAVIAYAARHARSRIGDENERRRLEAMDERRAAANLYAPDHRIEVAPQQPPQP